MASLAPAEKAPAGKPLKVGSPHDPAEREADRIADLLTAPEEPALPVCAACAAGGAPCAACGGGGGGVLRRKPLAGGVVNPVQPMRIHRKEAGGDVPAVTPSIESRLDATRGGGEPLPEAVRSQIEPRLGADLSGVRVHRGGEADALNRELRAQAFTRQRDIYFGAGRYQPETRRGQRLLAHELTHVVQQTSSNHASTSGRSLICNGSSSIGSNTIQRQDHGSERSYSDEMTARGRQFASRRPPSTTPEASSTTPTPSPELPSMREAYWEPESMSRYVTGQTQRLLQEQGWVETAEELWTPEFLSTASDEVKGDVLRRIRELIRLNAIRIMGAHREQVLSHKDRDLNADSAEREGNSLGSVSETVSTLRDVARNIQVLQQRRDRLESYRHGLERLSRPTYLGGQSASESVREMGEYASEYLTESRRTALRESYSRVPSRYRVGWVSRTARELSQWRQEQIDGVSLALGEVYTNFPFFAELDVEDALGRRYEEEASFRLAIAEAYNDIITAINSSIRQIATDDIDPYDLPVAVEGVKTALPQTLRTLLNEAISERQSILFWQTLGLTAFEVALIFVPVVGPALSAALSVATFAMDAESLLDRAVIEEASANPERNILGVQGPSAFEITMLAVQAALVAVDLGDVVRLLRGVPTVLPSAISASELIDASDEAVSAGGRAERALGDEVTEGTASRGLREGVDEVVDPEVLRREYDILSRRMQNPDNIRPVTNSALLGEGYQVEIEAGGHWYRRRSDGVWCRFSRKVCDINIPPELEEIAESLSIRGEAPIRTGIPGQTRNQFLTRRERLRLRIIENNLSPSWAVNPRDWDAHHIIPWEFRHHSAFDILRANGGWDHNDLLNAIALPTRRGIPGAESLPIHQGTTPALRGHGVYNEQIAQRLNQIVDEFELNPSRLREEVEGLIASTRQRFTSGELGGRILF